MQLWRSAEDPPSVIPSQRDGITSICILWISDKDVFSELFSILESLIGKIAVGFTQRIADHVGQTLMLWLSI